MVTFDSSGMDIDTGKSMLPGALERLGRIEVAAGNIASVILLSMADVMIGVEPMTQEQRRGVESVITAILRTRDIFDELASSVAEAAGIDLEITPPDQD